MLDLPVFTDLADAKSVLVAGAGGGFDIFSGLPLFLALRNAGKKVWLANLSFTRLREATGTWVAPAALRVVADSQSEQPYFPEKHLAAWFRSRGEEVPIFALERTGVRVLCDTYRRLTDFLGIDTVVLVDGGTDSLMRGDEAGLGTPAEDASSLIAVDALDIPRKLLLCVAFGVDRYHGVCHAQFLAAVAELIRAGAYRGAFSLTDDMPEVRLFREASAATFAAMPPNCTSIVTTSVLSALEGRYGDHHATERTRKSTLWINPLMSLCWCFRLGPVVERLMYRDLIRETESFIDTICAIDEFRKRLGVPRAWESIPV